MATKSAFERTAKYSEAEEKDRAGRALLKAKAVERNHLAKGWRYVQVTKNIQVLVPCDKNGKPTKEGQRRIDEVINR